METASRETASSSTETAILRAEIGEKSDETWERRVETWGRRGETARSLMFLLLSSLPYSSWTCGSDHRQMPQFMRLLALHFLSDDRLLPRSLEVTTETETRETETRGPIRLRRIRDIDGSLICGSDGATGEKHALMEPSFLAVSRPLLCSDISGMKEIEILGDDEQAVRIGTESRILRDARVLCLPNC